MRRDRRVVGLSHSRDETKLGDSAGIADVWLEDHRRLLLQNLPETPLGENAFAGGERDVRLPRQLRHYFAEINLSLREKKSEEGRIPFELIFQQPAKTWVQRRQAVHAHRP
jgi:hypothetical protein